MGKLCCCTPCANTMEEHHDLRRIQTIRLCSTTSIHILCCTWMWRKMEILFTDGRSHEPKIKFQMKDLETIGRFFEAHYGQSTEHVIILVLKEQGNHSILRRPTFSVPVTSSSYIHITPFTKTFFFSRVSFTTIGVAPLFRNTFYFFLGIVPFDNGLGTYQCKQSRQTYLNFLQIPQQEFALILCTDGSIFEWNITTPVQFVDPQII